MTSEKISPWGLHHVCSDLNRISFFLNSPPSAAYFLWAPHPVNEASNSLGINFITIVIPSVKMFSLLGTQNVQPISKEASVVPCGYACHQLMSWNDSAVLEKSCDSVAAFKLQELRVPFQTAWFLPCIFSLLPAAWWDSMFLFSEKSLHSDGSSLKTILLLYRNMNVMKLPRWHHTPTSLNLVDQNFSSESLSPK